MMNNGKTFFGVEVGGWFCSFQDQLLENVNKFLPPLPCCQLSRIKLNKPRNLHGIYKFPQRKFKWALLYSFITILFLKLKHCLWGYSCLKKKVKKTLLKTFYFFPS